MASLRVFVKAFARASGKIRKTVNRKSCDRDTTHYQAQRGVYADRKPVRTRIAAIGPSSSFRRGDFDGLAFLERGSLGLHDQLIALQAGGDLHVVADLEARG